jgi:hypothetical protein
MTTEHVTTYFKNKIYFIIQSQNANQRKLWIYEQNARKFMEAEKDRMFCDVILRSGLREIYAHRIILTMLSDYFTVLFKYEGGFKKPAIEFDENMSTGECLESIVDYSYSGKINITEDNMYDLLLASDYFDIRFIKTECEKFLQGLQNSDKDWINFEHLPTLTWFVCHLSLSSLLDPICIFISNHFIELRNKQILISLSPHCLLTLLKHKDMTACHNGVPVEDIELELFKFVSHFINEYDLGENIITDLLGTLELSEIQSELCLAVVESCPRIKNNYIIDNILIVQSLPSFVDENEMSPECSRGRKYSKLWKHINAVKGHCDPNIEIDDRICNITVYTFCGIPHSEPRVGQLLRLRDRWSSGSRDIENIISISGISITYRSGYIVTIGNTSDEPDLPLNKISRYEFVLAENEVIVKMTKYLGTITAIKFFTNLGNEFDPLGNEFEVDGFPWSKSLGPKGECGYFHSFEEECKIDALRMLWAEYSDPKTWQSKDGDVNTFEQLRRAYYEEIDDDDRHEYLDEMTTQHSDYFEDDDSDEDYYVDNYATYLSDSDDYISDGCNNWIDSD